MIKPKNTLSQTTTKYIYHQEDIIYSPFLYNFRRIEEAIFQPKESRAIESNSSQFIFLYVKTGSIKINSDDWSIILEQNEGILYQEKISTEWINISNSESECNYIVLKGGNITFLLNQKSKEQFFKVEITKSIENSFYEIIDETKKAKINDANITILVYKLLVELNGTVMYEKNKFTQPAIDYIANNYQNSELTMTELADYLHISYHYFIHLFKRENFVSPQKYLKKYRVEKALNLLKESNQSIENIAESVGFKYKKAFINACREETGLLPSKYQKEKKKVPLKATKRKKIIFTNVENVGDPFIFYENNRYYMFTTTRNGTNLNIYSSEDMKSYQQIGEALDRKQSFGVTDFWAPEVIKYNNEYFMFYSARGSDGLFHINVAKSKTIDGIYTDIDKNNPLINFKKSTVDAHPFVDNDGHKYLFFSMNYSTNRKNGKHVSDIYIIKLSDDFTQTIDKPLLIISSDKREGSQSSNRYYWNDAPFVLFKNGYYHLTYSANFFTNENYCVKYAKSKSVLGPYKKISEKPILSKIEGVITNPGHCSFFHDKNNDLKCVFHIIGKVFPITANRRACIVSAYFKDDNLLIDYK